MSSWRNVTTTITALITMDKLDLKKICQGKYFQKQFSSNKNIFNKLGMRNLHYFTWLSWADIDNTVHRHLCNLLSFRKFDKLCRYEAYLFKNIFVSAPLILKFKVWVLWPPNSKHWNWSLDDGICQWHLVSLFNVVVKPQ